MIKIVKASAGSGKTYNLAKEYIMLLTKGGRDAYKHILAVTFTNKATEEMKSRILQELHVLATEPSQSPYIDDLRQATGKSEGEIRTVVRVVLSNILHDYGMFSVSTIDKFFQQTLRAFSREIGQFASYQLELDRNSLIQETVDRLLDSLEEGSDMFSWLVANVREQIEENGRYNLQEGLVNIANNLKSIEHQTKVEEFGLKEAEAYSKENLSRIRKICVEVMREEEKTGDVEKNPSREYVTAKIIRGQLYGLGIAGEFYKGFDALMKEKNVLYIDETNTILKDIINGTETPFIYEKTGVKYENFLLDEFQDTSRVQWENFYPLLKESNDYGHECYIVGDVKQSIYRWRNSDWNLLAKELKGAFKEDAVESTLDTNFRSFRNIVEFNNAYFEFLAGILDGKSVNRPADATPVTEIYRDVRQKCSKKQDGCVKMVFCPKVKGRDPVCEEVVKAIGEVLEAGGKYGDVAILVRTKAQGAKVAAALMEHGLPFITNDSLSVKSSAVVNKLVSLLSFIDNPDDTVTGYLAKPLGIQPPKEYHSLVDLCEYLLRGLKGCIPEAVDRDVAYVRTFMDDVSAFASTNGNTIRGFLQHWAAANPVISLPETGNSITIMTIHKAKGLDFPYVIYPYAGSENMYSPDLHWCMPKTDEDSALKDCGNLYQVKLTASCADSFFAGDYADEQYKQYVDDINVAYVAMTRAAKVLHIISGSPTKGAVGAAKKNPYGFSGFGTLKDSLYLFANTDVARALGFREVWDCDDPVSLEGPASGKLDATKYKVRFQLGEMPDFSQGAKPSSVETLPASYPSWELNAERARLAVGFEQVDLFAEDEDGGTGSSDRPVSARVKGTVLHNLLASVTYAEDLDRTIGGAVMDGTLNEAEAVAAREFLGKAINSAVSRGWFSKDAVVRNETSIIDTDGREYRPDRVESRPDGKVVVIDYKFARPKPEYAAQVRHYAGLWRRMGERNVEAYLWYVYPDRVEQY